MVTRPVEPIVSPEIAGNYGASCIAALSPSWRLARKGVVCSGFKSPLRHAHHMGYATAAAKAA